MTSPRRNKSSRPLPADAVNRDLQAILDAFRVIVEDLRKSSADLQRTHGRTIAQLYVLRNLASGASRTINELAAATHTHQSTVSVVVKRLASDRLVRCSPAPADRRNVLVSITAAGIAAIRSCPPLTQERLVEAIAALGARETARLARHMRVIAKHLLPSGHPAMFFELPPDRRR
jgi:DNA-binding MarR family transcriptional regulator